MMMFRTVMFLIFLVFRRSSQVYLFWPPDSCSIVCRNSNEKQRYYIGHHWLTAIQTTASSGISLNWLCYRILRNHLFLSAVLQLKEVVWRSDAILYGCSSNDGLSLLKPALRDEPARRLWYIPEESNGRAERSSQLTEAF